MWMTGWEVIGVGNIEGDPLIENKEILDKALAFSKKYGIDLAILEEFLGLVQAGEEKPLSTVKIKAKVLAYFQVPDTSALKVSTAYKMAAEKVSGLDLRKKDSWKILYRLFVGVLPEEENCSGYGCINGLDIFKYFRPWQTFGLDPQVASPEDIKRRYRLLSKQYHPDIPETGDSKIFARITVFYKSLIAES